MIPPPITGRKYSQATPMTKIAEEHPMAMEITHTIVSTAPSSASSIHSPMQGTLLIISPMTSAAATKGYKMQNIAAQAMSTPAILVAHILALFSALSLATASARGIVPGTMAQYPCSSHPQELGIGCVPSFPAPLTRAMTDAPFASVRSTVTLWHATTGLPQEQPLQIGACTCVKLKRPLYRSCPTVYIPTCISGVQLSLAFQRGLGNLLHAPRPHVAVALSHKLLGSEVTLFCVHSFENVVVVLVLRLVCVRRYLQT